MVMANRESIDGSVLIIDDDPDIREVLGDRLEYLNCRVLMASSGEEGLELLETHRPQIVLLDIEMSGMSGLEVLKTIRKRDSEITVLMITAYGTIERAVEAMREGAYDFIRKPFETDQIALTVKKALERERLKREVGILSEELDERYRLIAGKSTKMNQAIDLAKKAALSKSTVLLLGESGTGKELFARAIHKWSDRQARPFVPINCVGLAKELLESELFGHEKGAFTGAHQLKVGKMELAHGGTVFLDEVGDIAAEVQTKLLRFLQEREFERIGGNNAIRVDVRIVAATNRDLDQAVRENHFREDLYYRLNVVPITLPPLRERKEDIPSLAGFFMARFAREAKKTFTKIGPETMERLSAYEWPGNVRELANVIERAVVLGSGPTLTLEEFSSVLAEPQLETEEGVVSYREAMDRFRKEIIRQALLQTHGNRAAAAKALGLQRTYLSKLIRLYGID